MRRLGILVASVGLVLVLWASIAPRLATRLIIERPLDRADAIIVLSGSSVYRERTAKAAELYKELVAPRVFITNDGGRAGWSQAEQTNLPFVEMERRELVAGGVPPDSITILRGEVAGTESEAKALAAEIDVRPLTSMLIVTSAYHSRRALWTFEKAFADKGVTIGIRFAPITSQSTQPATWWLSLNGWLTIGGEYVKSAGYWLVY
jgi:uncharacterized SAM-binding protein YcdF (DUF218 family)